MYKIEIKAIALALIGLGFSFQSGAQTGTGSQSGVQEYLDIRKAQLYSDPRPVQTAVPFLGIAPDARSAGMGDIGVASSPDNYSTYWNPAKVSQMKNDFGGAISFNPWLRKIVQDMSLTNGSFYYKLRKEDAISINFTYFDLGSITFTDNTGAVITDFKPNEISAGAQYSRLLGRGFSVGVGLKYIYSNLAGSISNDASTQARPAQAAAADLGFYYNKDVVIADRDFNIAFGAAIANIGNKVSYSNSSRADFIPTILRLGSTVTYVVDDFNKFSFLVQASKLMVPSTQIVAQTDVNSGTVTGYAYQVPDKNLVNGMFSSFADAPNGFKEEMQEVMLSGGVEYWYDDMFAVRTGYFYENPQKGNRNYITFGFSFRYNVFGLDGSYLVATQRTNPLAETFRFGLTFNFDKPKTKVEDSVVE